MLAKFCFYNKGYNVVTVEAENINNITIPNKYCKSFFPCPLSLEEDINDIEEINCVILYRILYLSLHNCDGKFVMYNGNEIHAMTGSTIDEACNSLSASSFENIKKNFTIINKITHKNISASPVYVNKTVDNHVIQKYTVPVNVTRTVQASPMLRTINKTVTENLNKTSTKYVPLTETCTNKSFVYIPETSIINPSPVYNTHNQTITKYINNTFTENINTTKTCINPTQTSVLIPINSKEAKLDKIDFINKTTYNNNFLPCLNQTYGNTSLQNEIKHVLG